MSHTCRTELCRAVELNADYFRDGLRHLREAARDAAAPTLFGLMTAEREVAA